MPLDHDAILLETVRTRRARLHSALLHGGQPRRRPVTTNVRRLVGGAVLAAVLCAGCVGFAVVTGVLADRSTRDRPPATAPATPGTPAATGAPAVTGAPPATGAPAATGAAGAPGATGGSGR
jgi:hypothetical protein